MFTMFPMQPQPYLRDILLFDMVVLTDQCRRSPVTLVCSVELIWVRTLGGGPRHYHEIGIPSARTPAQNDSLKFTSAC